jgi:hypothetical protein
MDNLDDMIKHLDGIFGHEDSLPNRISKYVERGYIPKGTKRYSPEQSEDVMEEPDIVDEGGTRAHWGGFDSGKFATRHKDTLAEHKLSGKRMGRILNSADLPNKINKFVNKAVQFDSAEDAKNQGVKLPAAFDKPEEPSAPKESELPKLPKDSTKTQKPNFGKKPSRIISEIGQQLSPKGPGYHSPEEIAADIEESKRMGEKFAGLFSRKKPPIAED